MNPTTETPELAENPNCLETHARFGIVGDSLVPGDVTRSLGLTPTFAVAKGESFTTPAGSERHGRSGVWFIETKDRLQTTSLERHLILLLNELEPRKAEIARIGQSRDLRI